MQLQLCCLVSLIRYCYRTCLIFKLYFRLLMFVLSLLTHCNFVYIDFYINIQIVVVPAKLNVSSNVCETRYSINSHNRLVAENRIFCRFFNATIFSNSPFFQEPNFADAKTTYIDVKVSPNERNFMPLNGELY